MTISIPTAVADGDVPAEPGAIPATAGAIPATAGATRAAARAPDEVLPAETGTAPATVPDMIPVTTGADHAMVNGVCRRESGIRQADHVFPTGDGTNHDPQRQVRMSRIFRNSVLKNAWRTTKANTEKDKKAEPQVSITVPGDRSPLRRQSARTVRPAIPAKPAKVVKSLAETGQNPPKIRQKRKNRLWAASA